MQEGREHVVVVRGRGARGGEEKTKRDSIRLLHVYQRWYQRWYFVFERESARAGETEEGKNARIFLHPTD